MDSEHADHCRSALDAMGVVRREGSDRLEPALGAALGEHAARVNLENILAPNLASTMTQTHATSVDEPLARISTDFSNAIAEVSLGHELEYLAAHPAHLAALAISCGAVYYIVTRGRQKIRRLKAEFLSHGIDLTNVDDRLDTLTYLKKMQDQGMLPLGLEVCAMKQAEMEVLFMGNDGIAKWKKYYAERGIDIDQPRPGPGAQVRREPASPGGMFTGYRHGGAVQLTAHDFFMMRIPREPVQSRAPLPQLISDVPSYLHNNSIT